MDLTVVDILHIILGHWPNKHGLRVRMGGCFCRGWHQWSRRWTSVPGRLKHQLCVLSLWIGRSRQWSGQTNTICDTGWHSCCYNYRFMLLQLQQHPFLDSNMWLTFDVTAFSVSRPTYATTIAFDIESNHQNVVVIITLAFSYRLDHLLPLWGGWSVVYIGVVPESRPFHWCHFFARISCPFFRIRLGYRTCHSCAMELSECVGCIQTFV